MKLQREIGNEHYGQVMLTLSGKQEQVEKTAKKLNYHWGHYDTQCGDVFEGQMDINYLVDSCDLKSFRESYKEAKKLAYPPGTERGIIKSIK